VLSFILHLTGVFIVLYMLRMDMKSVLDRPLFWTETTMTIGTFIGGLFIVIGFLIK
jgi:hypothetical protein